MPKAFISYSWTNQAHQETVKAWADRLIADGVEVILDLYDLKEGDDKFAFMEKMISDSAITHVLVISDQEYSQKADSRKKGVGTESQIISKEIYEKTEQSKFIPIVCEFDDEMNPYLPIFLRSRIWIDFSTLEAVNGNWERLIRLLFDRPLHQKPKLGTPPAFISNADNIPSNPSLAKFSSLKQIILNSKPGQAAARSDFLAALFDHVNEIKSRSRPEIQDFAASVVEESNKLVQVRDQFVDWILLERTGASSGELESSLLEAMEKLRELKYQSDIPYPWSEIWTEAYELFLYELIHYIVASLLKTEAFSLINAVLNHHYLIPKNERHGNSRFEGFESFYKYSETLISFLSPEGRTLRSAAAELIKRQATRPDLPFSELIQADLLLAMAAFCTRDREWFPQLMFYAGRFQEFPFFIKASRRKDFLRLAQVLGVNDADSLRTDVAEGMKRAQTDRWNIGVREGDLRRAANLDDLDSL